MDLIITILPVVTKDLPISPWFVDEKLHNNARRTENAFGNDDCLRQPACFL